MSTNKLKRLSCRHNHLSILAIFTLITITPSTAFAFCLHRQLSHITTYHTKKTMTSRRSSSSRRRLSSSSSSISTISEFLSQWASSSGYGSITSDTPQGSSGWASFRRLSVSNPPDTDVTFFVKSSTRSHKEMFEGEALGLKAMKVCSEDDDDDDDGGETNDDGASSLLRIPKVYYDGDWEKGSVLIMEYLNLKGRGDDRALGRAVARMHLAQPSAAAGNPDGLFGFPLDNTIGGTPQPNTWSKGGSTSDWISFYRDKRIGHQLTLAGDSYCSRLWDKDIAPRLEALFEGIEVRPSLLHGDLWSGNIGSADGRPTIYDPAVYWGHHEAEWGMSWCAGFGAAFWTGYRELIPEDDGFQQRKPLYDAYHQLNHYNLFGGGYLSSARGDLERVKAALDKLGA